MGCRCCNAVGNPVHSQRSLVIGLWPVLGIASLPVIVVEMYGAVMALHFAPTFGFLRVKKVHSD